MSADSLTGDHSPRSKVTTDTTSGGGGGGGVNIPQSRRGSLASPWASVVRGDSEPISSPTATVAADIPRSSLSPRPIGVAAEQALASEKGSVENLSPETQLESSDTNNDGNAGSPKRPAWNKPVNGGVDPGSIMGGSVSWPALSESIRPVPRSSDSSRPFSDGSPSSSQRQANSHANANSTASHTMPTRQRPIRHRGRGGGGISHRNGPSQTGFSSPSPPMPPPVPPPYPLFNMPYGTVVPPVMDTTVRGMRPVGGVRGSQSHASNDHSQHRNNSRRANFGQRGRGDGPHYNNHVRLPHHYMPPHIGFMPSPPLPGTATFIRHPPVRAFADSLGFDMASSRIYIQTMPSESFRMAMPLVTPPPPSLPPMPLTAVMDTLPTLIVRQIDYYFSDGNLSRDHFLRGNMDAEGWVPISLIATFPRVQKLTPNIQMILDSLRASTVVEIQGDKIRKRGWKAWLQNSNSINTDSGSQPPDASAEKFLARSLQKVSFDDTSTNVNTSAKDLTGQAMLANGEDTKDGLEDEKKKRTDNNGIECTLKRLSPNSRHFSLFTASWTKEVTGSSSTGFVASHSSLDHGHNIFASKPSTNNFRPITAHTSSASLIGGKE
ncbi:la-related protein 1C-like [Forsythia ovata]|uniref:La-related protein 1C-like n=1 Tax=Forsythia ovata TaxID=205694 RepID=A0ABD1UB92_9LAMI